MEILEKIGDAASKTYKFTAEKTSKIAKETKLRIKINECKRKIEEIYEEIGEAVYQKHVVDEDIKMDELKEKCEEIDNLSQKIIECKNEILSLKEKRQCANCYEEIEINAHYCPNCGFEQPEIVQEEKKEECNCENCEAQEEQENQEEQEEQKENIEINKETSEEVSIDEDDE